MCTPNNLSVVPSTTSLHERALLVAREHVAHRPEVGAVDVDRLEAAARVGFRQPHASRSAAGRTPRSARSCDRPTSALVVDGVGERVAVADRDRRQVHAVGHVADRVDGFDAALRELIDDHRAGVVELDAGAFEAESRRCSGMRPMAYSTTSASTFSPVDSVARIASPAFSSLRERGLHREPRAAALHLDVHVRAQVVVEAAQHACRRDAGCASRCPARGRCSRTRARRSRRRR